MAPPHILSPAASASAAAVRQAACQVPLLRDLPQRDLEQIVQVLHYRVAAPDIDLLTIGGQGEAIYFLLRGTLKIVLEQADGTDLIVSVCGPGEVIGEMNAVDRQGHSASVVALETCELLWMSCEAFRHFLQTVPALGYNLAHLLTQRLRCTNIYAQRLVKLDIAGRLAFQLLHFVERYGVPTDNGANLIPLQLRQQDLAAMVGATRERVNAVLGEFRHQGIITLGPQRRIIVHKKAALYRLCNPGL